MIRHNGHEMRGICFVVQVMAILVPFGDVIGETVYVDSKRGLDANAGTEQRPVKTLARAAAIVNASREAGPTTIRARPGIYALGESVVLNADRSYTPEERLTIEATLNPDDPAWTVASMPIILSVEDPRQAEDAPKLTQSYGLRIKNSHVTVRGLKFLGNPLAAHWYCALECLGPEMKDVLVTQCVFIGSADALDIYCAFISDGHQIVLDHCIFFDCCASAVFWDGGRGVIGTGNTMRYCIVDGARLAAVWTCDTAEDFEFHHNIITRCQYAWMRKRGEPRTYRLRDSIITDNAHSSGYGVESGATGETGPEVSWREERVTKVGQVVLEKNRDDRRYLHARPGTLGSKLGAGLFTGR